MGQLLKQFHENPWILAIVGFGFAGILLTLPSLEVVAGFVVVLVLIHLLAGGLILSSLYLLLPTKFKKMLPIGSPNTMVDFSKKYGPWALITGASSGIGEEFCRQLAAQKINLVMVARRKDRLEKISRELKDRHGIETRLIVSDISKPDFLPQITNVTNSLDIGFLVNNAGFALTGSFLDHSLEEELSLLYVNCRAPLMLAHMFGKKMVKRGGGGIINVSSVSGFMSVPFWTHYAAAKAYSLHFSEGLWFELKGKEVDVLALCPGGTNTEFSQVAGTKRGGMKPSTVVAIVLRDLGRKPTTIVGMGNRMIVLLSKIMPRPWMIKMGANAVRNMANRNV